MSSPGVSYFGDKTVAAKYHADGLALWRQLYLLVQRTSYTTKRIQRFMPDAKITVTASVNMMGANLVWIEGLADGATLQAVFDIACIRDVFYDYTRLFSTWDVSTTSPFPENPDEASYPPGTDHTGSTFPTHWKPLPDIYNGEAVTVHVFIGNYTQGDWENVAMYTTRKSTNIGGWKTLLNKDGTGNAGNPAWVDFVADIDRDGYTWYDLSYTGSTNTPIRTSGSVMIDGKLCTYYHERPSGWHGYLLCFDPETMDQVADANCTLPDFLVGSGTPYMFGSHNHQTVLHDSINSTSFVFMTMDIGASSDVLGLCMLDYDTSGAEPKVVGAPINLDGMFIGGRPWRMHVSENYVYLLAVEARSPATETVTHDVQVSRVPRYDFWRPTTAYKATEDVRFALSTDGTLCVLTCTSAGTSGATLTFDKAEVAIPDGTVSWSVAVYAPTPEVVLNDTIWGSFYGGQLGCAGLAVSPDDANIFTAWRYGVVDDLFYDWQDMRGQFNAYAPAETPAPDLYEKTLERIPAFEGPSFDNKMLGSAVIGLKYK
jgi:hypothetical protein